MLMTFPEDKKILLQEVQIDLIENLQKTIRYSLNNLDSLESLSRAINLLIQGYFLIEGRDMALATTDFNQVLEALRSNASVASENKNLKEEIVLVNNELQATKNQLAESEGQLQQILQAAIAEQEELEVPTV